MPYTYARNLENAKKDSIAPTANKKRKDTRDPNQATSLSPARKDTPEKPDDAVKDAVGA